MPATGPETLTARSRGTRDGTHPTLDAGETLMPTDALRGKGNMSTIEPDGHPEGMKIVRIEQPEYKHVYAGITPNATDCTRQTTNGVPSENSSWLGDAALVNGVPFPTAGSGLLAKLPRPEPPIVVKETVSNVGFAATTAQSPGWLALSYSRDGTKWGRPTPPVSYQNAHGQNLRVFLGDAGIGGSEGGFVGILLAAPGTSSASRPGPMHLVKIIDLSKYFLDYYDLTGPFRPLRPAPTTDETGLGEGSAPIVRKRNTRYMANPGEYMACVTFTFGEKEGRRGSFSNSVTLQESLWLNLMQQARQEMMSEAGELGELLGGGSSGGVVPLAYGYIDIIRPPAPPGATGWYCYVRRGIEWFRVWLKSTEEGRATPLPLSLTKVWTAGWKGDENEYATRGIDGLLTSGTPPEVDGTALGDGDSAPEAPIALGRSRMGPGVVYFRVTDGLDGMQTLPSEPVSVNLGDDEIPRLIFQNPVNRVPNGHLLERAPGGLPLDHTFTTDNGAAFPDAESGEPILQTNGPVSGTTPTEKTAWMEADPETGGRAAARLSLEAPKNGSVQGAVELVLEEQNAAGAVTSTVLGAISQLGEARFDKILHPSGSTGLPAGSVVLDAATSLFRLAVRFTGSTKNGSARVTYLEAKRHKHRHRLRLFRWLRRHRRVRHPKPLPPPGSEVDCDPPPPPPPSPEPVPPTDPEDPPNTSPNPHPQRPLLEAGAAGLGKILEQINFDAGLPGGGWTQEKSASATLAANATAAISGANGLFVSDQSAVENGFSAIKKDFGPTPFLSASVQGRWGQTPEGGVVEVCPIRRESDGRPIAWLECGEVTEISELEVEAGPGQPGSVTINLDGTPYDVAVGAVKEQARFTISTPPSQGGSIQIDLGGVVRNIPVGGTYEQARLKFHSTGFWQDEVRVSIGGISQNVPIGGFNFSVNQAAARVASYPFPGWYVWATGDTVYFQAQTTGAKTNLSFDPRGSNVSATATTTVDGATETTAQLAARVRSTDFGSGWVLTQGNTTSEVIFTATRAGASTDISVSVGGTGVGGTIAILAQGSADTPTELATKIRNASYPGYVTGGSGTLVTFSATGAGDQLDASFSPGPTGAEATMTTTRRGQGSEMFLKAQDDAGNIYGRKLTSPVGDNVWNVDFGVVGAGTEHGTVTAWGSVGSDEKELLERFDALDLSESAVGELALGVTGSTGAAVTWELHLDNIKVTERGEKWFFEHGPDGKVVNQFHHYGLPTQPLRDDIGIQELYDAVIPGATYTLSAWVFDEGAPAGTIPVSVRGFSESSPASPVELGDIEVGGSDSDWREINVQVEIPEDCHYVEIRSRALSAGEVVVQSVVLSPGAEPDRTGTYATSGEYKIILQLMPDRDRGDMSVSRRRKMLEADSEQPAGTSIVATYRSAPNLATAWGTTYSDPEEVPDRSFVEATFAFSGNGLDTPELSPGSPRAEYLTTLEGKHIATFLREDRTELPGGAFFDHSEESVEPPDASMRVLPGFRLRPNVFGEAAPRMPGAESGGSGGGGQDGETVGLYLFTEEAKKLIEKYWYEPWSEEAYGEAMKVRLSAMPIFTRLGGETRRNTANPFFTHALYYAEMPERQILHREILL